MECPVERPDSKYFRPLILSSLLCAAAVLGPSLPAAAQNDLPGRQDVFLAGYVSAVLERDFAVSGDAASVRDGVVTLRLEAIAGKSSTEIARALEKLKGVRAVRITEAGAGAPCGGRPSGLAPGDPDRTDGGPAARQAAVRCPAGGPALGAFLRLLSVLRQ